MTNIFLFRHGETINKDYDGEKLSTNGMKQAKKAGEIISYKLTERLKLAREKKVDWKELEGLLKVNSGCPRSLNFLEIMSQAAEKNFPGQIGFNGEYISIKSPQIFSDDGAKKIIEIIDCCYPIAGIQMFVGHHPEVAKVANHYVEKKEFDFIGDKIFLSSTAEGLGYWINTFEKNVEIINAPQQYLK